MNFMDFNEEFWKYRTPEYEPIIDEDLTLQLESPIYGNEMSDEEIELERKKQKRTQRINSIFDLMQNIAQKKLEKELKNDFIAERVCMDKYFNLYSNKDLFEDKVREVQGMINNNVFDNDETKNIFEKSIKRRLNELLLEKIENNFGSLRMKSGENVIDDGVKVTEYQGEFSELIQDLKDGKFEVFNERVEACNLKKILKSLELETANKFIKPVRKKERDSFEEDIIYEPEKDLDTLNKLCRTIWQEMTELGIYEVNGDSYNVKSKNVDKVLNKIWKLKELTKKDNQILREQMILELADYYPDINIAEAVNTMKTEKVGCVDVMRMIADGKFDRELEKNDGNKEKEEIPKEENLPIQKEEKGGRIANFFKNRFSKIKNIFSRKKGIAKELDNKDAKRYNEFFEEAIPKTETDNPWKVSGFKWENIQLENVDDVNILDENKKYLEIDEK